MLEHRLFDSTQSWRRRRRLRPMVLAVFSYRYDTELVPDLLQNIEPIVDGWVAFDDRDARNLFSDEPVRRRLLIERARELGATWVLAIDPDERIEVGAATRIRSLVQERQRIVWELNLREMFTAKMYRVDGIWGSKMQGRLFPVFDGPLCSERPLHGAWCVAPAGYSVLAAGLNLYHLKMMSFNRRLARRNLYRHLDPHNLYQSAGYDYLVDENDAMFEQIPLTRDFFPAHPEFDDADIHMADVEGKPQAAGAMSVSTCKRFGAAHRFHNPETRATLVSQLGQLRISIGKTACRDSKIAVVVIGFRAQKSLFDAVASLIRQDTASEIVVVNSGGGDVSGVLGEHLASVALVELTQPLKVGAARNVGIQVSRAAFVGFLAGDCVAGPGWVAERIQAHMEGECAVASVVENDKPRNPFSWAAHLMTYGHRIAGAADSETAVYGASYDRTLFDKYGLFSEAMVIGEDSEFHSRFRRSDTLSLHESIRTAHCNPAEPISFLADQFRRGLRGRYLADFFHVELSAAYIALATVRRFTRPVRLSLACLRGKQRLLAMMSWPLLPFGAISYLGGMIVGRIKARTADRFFAEAVKMDLLGQPVPAVNLMRRAIDLRPVTARYHLVLSALLKQIGEHDDGARELYASWEIDRHSLVDLCGTNPSAGPADGESTRWARPFSIRVVVFADGSDVQLARFLRAVGAQRSPFVEPDVIVVGDRRGSQKSALKHLATFVSPQELPRVLSSEQDHRQEGSRPFVVVSSCSCLPSHDWLATLRAYIMTYPEVELFHGRCRPLEAAAPGFVERLSYDLGFFPRAADNGGLLRFGRAVSWACDESLLAIAGGLTKEKTETLDGWTLTERVLEAGASSLDAPDWQASLVVDSTLVQLLRCFFREGYHGAKHAVASKDSDLVSGAVSEGSLRGSIVAAWRFMADHLKVWRFERRSFLAHAPACLILLSIGLVRQVGWRAGLKGFRGDIRGSRRNQGSE
jgi:GT2 family glycosyltransferase